MGETSLCHRCIEMSWNPARCTEISTSSFVCALQSLDYSDHAAMNVLIRAVWVERCKGAAINPQQAAGSSDWQRAAGQTDGAVKRDRQIMSVHGSFYYSLQRMMPTLSQSQSVRKCLQRVCFHLKVTLFVTTRESFSLLGHFRAASTFIRHFGASWEDAMNSLASLNEGLQLFHNISALSLASNIILWR